MALVVDGLDPNMSILGDTQNFIFTPNNGFFGVQSLFVPTSINPSKMSWQFANSQLSGFRFTHLTNIGDTVGTFKFQTFLNGSTASTDILTLSENGTFFNKPFSFPDPVNPLDGANKRYVDARIPSGTISSLTGFVQGINPVSGILTTTRGADCLLTNIPAGGDVNMGNFKLINLATPINTMDAANKGYIDGKTWVVSQITNFDASVRSYHLNDFLSPLTDLSMNNHKLTALALPTLNADAATKGYVDTAISSFSSTITLQGDVSGTGAALSAITITINKPLNQMPLPVGAVNFNGQLLQNLATPIAGTDGANRSYVLQESNIAGVTGQIAVTGTNPKNIGLVQTSVTAGSYRHANVTADQYGRITALSNGFDRYQNLNFATALTWNWESGNIANVTLTGNTTLTIVPGTATDGVLIVKQDSVGNRNLALKTGIYNPGSTNPNINLTAGANKVDVLYFSTDINGAIYFYNIVKDMRQVT